MSLESKKTTADSKLVEEHLVVTCGGLIHNQQLTHPTLVTMVGHGIIVFKDVIALTVSEVRLLRCAQKHILNKKHLSLNFKAFGVVTWLHAQHAIMVHVKSLTVWQNAFVQLDGF